MKRISLLNLLLVFIVLLFSCSVSKIHDAPAQAGEVLPQYTDSLYGEINKLGKELTTKNHVPGLAVAVLKNGKIAWTQCVGYADVASQRLVTPQTVFNVGSIS